MLPAERILIIRPSALGDVARSVCVLASLRAAYPKAQIDWLVRDTFAPVIAHHPALSNVIAFPRNEFARWTRTLRLGSLHAYGRSLRARGYDVVLDCQGLARSGWLAWASDAKVRIGNRHARELSWLFATHRVPVPRGLHSVETMLALLEPLGVPALRDREAMRLHTASADRSWLRTQPFAGRSYVVLAPTSAWETKEWPADRFAQVADALSKRGAADGTPVVIVGAKHERDRIGPLLEVARRNPLVIDRVGTTTIGQLMATIEASSLVVANDSASLHIAVGFDRKVVALLGPTDPKLVGPFGRERDVLQHTEPGETFAYRKETTRRMISRITTQEVLDACEARLG